MENCPWQYFMQINAGAPTAERTVNLHAFILTEIKQAGCWEADITVEKVAFPLHIFSCINSAEPY